MTTTEDFYVGAYWLARPESKEECARRAERVFHELARCDPSLDSWYEQAYTKKEALQRRFETDLETLLKLFRKEEYDSDGDGISFAAWNGRSESGTASGLSLFCGSGSVWVSNSCVFHPPRKGSDHERLVTGAALRDVLRSMVVAWNPELGVACSHEFQDMVTEKPAVDTFVGWVTYFSRRRGVVPPLPAPVRIDPVDELGWLITLTPERVSASNPEHVALAKRVGELLDRAGLMGPLKPWS